MEYLINFDLKNRNMHSHPIDGRICIGHSVLLNYSNFIARIGLQDFTCGSISHETLHVILYYIGGMKSTVGLDEIYPRNGLYRMTGKCGLPCSIDPESEWF